jgi:hypothetical protein
LQWLRFAFESEVTALKAAVAEVRIRNFPRMYMEGKKIRWTDGIAAAMWHIAGYNLNAKNTLRRVEKGPGRYRVSNRQWL